MGMTKEGYRSALQQLLPRGLVWVRALGTRLTGLLTGFARTLLRVDNRLGDLARETDPTKTVEAITDWEKLAGLPDDCCCTPTVSDDLDERRQAVILRLTNEGGQSKPYFIQLAAMLGFQITINEFRPFRAGISRCGDPLNSREMSFMWVVRETDSTLPTDLSEQAAEAIACARAALVCIFRRYKPAHTDVVFYFIDYLITEDETAFITAEDGTPFVADGLWTH
ncbi:YmfQ family protein [Paraburkholderia adhaesiva]|uniref:YmfQ family protein n=1 Tax=Paraburkholderia adhaesiva TaxID=2883244 RepID=UPI001F3B6CD5|nr:putative phage tail protein [Paraburkholderia adhaesiva]